MMTVNLVRVRCGYAPGSGNIVLFMYLLPPKMHKPLRGSEIAVVLKGSYILGS